MLTYLRRSGKGVERHKRGRSVHFSSELPSPPEFPGWRSRLREAVQAASNRSDRRAYHWIAKVELKETTFEELADSEGLVRLDDKLSVALGKVANKGTLGLDIRTKSSL